MVFLKNRFLRIYPTFWASVVIILFIPYLVEAVSSLKTGHYLAPETIIDKFNFSEWLNFLMLTKVFFASSDNLATEFDTINAVYWTLAIEFQFYLVVFLALYLGKYYKHAIALLSGVAILLKLFPVNFNYGLFIHYWPSFSFGIALAYLHRNEIRFHPDSKGKKALLLVLVITTIQLISYMSPIPLHTSPILFAAGFGIYLWFFSDLENVLKRMKQSGSRITYWLLEPWLIMGAMSYSLYLLHVKLYLIPLMFVRQLIRPDSLLFALLTILGTLALCYPFYLLVERRFLSKNYKKIHQEVITSPSTV